MEITIEVKKENLESWKYSCFVRISFLFNPESLSSNWHQHFKEQNGMEIKCGSKLETFFGFLQIVWRIFSVSRSDCFYSTKVWAKQHAKNDSIQS